MTTELQQLDDLVLRLQGLELARDYRKLHGAEARELAMFSTEIDRVRVELTRLLGPARAPVAARRIDGRRRHRSSWFPDSGSARGRGTRWSPHYVPTGTT
jgi:hypothetical protein